jgi:hypothetical protein
LQLDANADISENLASWLKEINHFMHIWKNWI